MTIKLADMHIHSYHSDGTITPKEILDSALSNNVGLLAITDHDTLVGTLELQDLCREANILYLPGVELDSLENKVNIHILAYGIDLNDENFRQFVSKNWTLLDTVNAKLIEEMQVDYSCISVADYQNYSYNRRLGGWKALHYLMDRGLTKALREGFPLYIKYGCTYDCVDFPSVKTVCQQIHMAGGKAILAHPGVTIKENDISRFEKEALKLLSYGIDGIECYYPTHTPEITQLCLDICNGQNLLITTGSDCHGTFGTAEIGETNITIDMLNLGDLLKTS